MLLTAKQISERRAALKKEGTDLLNVTKERAFTPEERSSLERIQNELNDLVAQEQDAESRNRLSGLLSGGEGRSPSDSPYSDDGENRDSPFHIANMRKWRLGAALRHAKQTQCNWDSLKGVEGEAHQELRNNAKANNLPSDGFMMPHCLPIHPDGRSEQRSTDVTNMAGALTVQQSTTLLDVLRNKMVASLAGARILSGLVGSYEQAKKTLANTVRWVGESPSLVLTDMTAGKITFTPKTITAGTRVTARLIEQTSHDVEAEARRDVAMAIAIGADAAVWVGSGSSNQPQGLYGHSDVIQVAIGTNGGAPTRDILIDLESARNHVNADLGTPVFVTSSKGLAKLRKTPIVAGYPSFLADNSSVDGISAYTTNQIPSNYVKGTSGANCTAVYYGDFSQIVIGMWGGVRLIVDPFAVQPDQIVTMYQTMDIQLMYGAAIARIVDMLIT